MKRPVIIQPLFIAALSILAFSCSDTLGQMSPLRYPPLRGGQIRIEGYLVPAVTSWPAYPSWAPRGDRIAFSMDGQIWTVPNDGGKARQVTSSPGYDFEPDWSPNGEWLAFSRDRGGNLDIVRGRRNRKSGPTT